ncbi:hypothetical protein GOARA_061_00870 [Gordonia araii NBRC 100433]|uniref:Lon N-terminal domain-containing protein n=1 Tax=Gordonia araii NBRC 100433 TaxID=1073574 RepID=G7H473_9ACTN|nr:LON peptidase substrate-binding domain-containing protein [Gordonia araii]NNG96291.1 hypothetical protein [Gordonia araii NBRC 100433]GAB10648.1 hypothetical protein GOARA_061_00870 [Gordonia araii NBRC 100433]
MRATATELPMFPLGSTLLPGATLPLRIFEPRYIAMMDHCIGGEPRFGVVLIERGSEVGGGDVRTDAGVIAEIVDYRQSRGGTYSVFCQGSERIRVDEWLVDDPYPRARVSAWPDQPVAAADWETCRPQLQSAVGDLLNCIQTLAARSGRHVALPQVTDASLSPGEFTWATAGSMPITEADRYRALTAPDPISRAQLLIDAMRDAESALRFRMQ